MGKIKDILHRLQLSKYIGMKRLILIAGSCGFLIVLSGALLIAQDQSKQSNQNQGQQPNQGPPNQGPIDERIKSNPIPPGQENPPPSDQKGGEQKGGSQPAPAPSSPGAPVDSNTYKIGPADILNIRVWGESAFSGLVAVHQDGKFTLPLVGDLQAGGLTPAEVQDIVAKALTKYVVKPLVTITVQEVGSKRYYMDGFINRAGEYPLIVPTTILEAISKAGGCQDFANTKKIYVLRGSKRIYFNLNDVKKGKNMDQNILIQPGDHIWVP